MNTYGFHYTEPGKRVGYNVDSTDIEQAQPITAGQRHVWQYDERLPDNRDVAQDRYFYTLEDIAELTGWELDDIAVRARAHGWRWRRQWNVAGDTRVYGFYLMDLLATVWSYMTSWGGNRISEDLLTEAKGYMARKAR